MAISKEDTDDIAPPRYYTTKRMGVGAHTMTRAEYMERSRNLDRHLGDGGYKRHDTSIAAAP